LRTQLESQVQRLGLADRVIFAGMVADPAPIYRDLDLFVLPSLAEGTSISILEALASGTPVVATAVGGTPALLANGACGDLVPPCDVEAMATALRRVLSDAQYRARLAAAARARALAEYDEAAMVRAYEGLYHRIGLTHGALVN
jgi:glycosyltransferase involved in cell wall biosynthesis